MCSKISLCRNGSTPSTQSSRAVDRFCKFGLGRGGEAARRFYEAAFEVEFVEERHGDGPRHLMASFGRWPSDQFFLLNLSERIRDPDRTGRADFGFLVDDLDTVHKRALAAGATEACPPEVLPGMPRSSTILDPSGNRINLYQDASATEC